MFGWGLTDESDLDGTVIAGLRLRQRIWSVFGLEPSREHYKEYNEEFWEQLKNKSPVTKTKPRPDGPLNSKSNPNPIYKPVW